MKFYAFLVITTIVLLGYGCKSDSDQSSATSSGSGNADPIEYLGTGEPKYNLYIAETTDEFKDASIDAWSYKNGRFDFEIGGDSYELKAQTSDQSSLMCANSDQGQHLHIIVDSKPYSAQYTSSFDFDISNGQHHLLAFLGKSYHESIKEPAAHIARLVDVEDGNITNEWNIPTPTLFYSRPKGTYVGKDAKKILIDFYPVNINIGEDAKIMLQINGEQYYLYEWHPFFIEGLPYGDNTIGIQLVDLNGQPISGVITSHYRKFRLVKDPAEDIKN
ncbi:hypothetical protein KUV50_12255 [Membranicola marinus]|uniref:Uncharacterized protein n=1 Tax=Membranihabitans marinus TaxID=1227546 RepID=A0A953HVA1_9BACT|nr:hypothetical protein [Membranihabitans marinus]MBY5958915.1 hypothetical protein [Membranihabitans marinus]